MITRSTPVYRVEVRLRPEFADAEGQAALALLHGCGLYAARELRSGKVYEIRATFNMSQVQQAARELLCDGVTQEWKVLNPGPPHFNGMSHWRVEVWPKPSVTDPAGETVRTALSENGLPQPEWVRVGSVYHITGKCHRNQLERAVWRSLANPLIHRVSVTEAHQ
ncbi:MAG: phosphoribosylformylglycinamidine synthase subunit PurS [Elusimicrobia bacterium]|nr:phosphoribosylformylglycinamidine synthase subunit PurS [Elusimicrobiota bacterium]